MSSALVSPVAGNPANVSPVLMFHFFPIAAAARCEADEQAFIFAPAPPGPHPEERVARLEG
jgi:hypothetical protein